jgi:chromosome segregation ATPase
MHNLISQQQKEMEDIGSQAAAQAREIADLENRVGRQLHEKDDLRTANKEQRSELETLKQEKSRVEGLIAMRAYEMEGLKSGKGR